MILFIFLKTQGSLSSLFCFPNCVGDILSPLPLYWGKKQHTFVCCLLSQQHENISSAPFPNYCPGCSALEVAFLGLSGDWIGSIGLILLAKPMSRKKEAVFSCIFILGLRKHAYKNYPRPSFIHLGFLHQPNAVQITSKEQGTNLFGRDEDFVVRIKWRSIY